MASRAIPNEVEQFLLAAIDTVPHLEALLLIFQSPDKTWTVEDLAARIYVDNSQAAAVLDDLTRRKLIQRVEQSPPQYQFLAASPAQTELLHKVAQAYRTQLVQVARFIHSKPSASVRDFARAFRLKDRD
jgi:DNA-binding MarR family transcriptional regulator